MSKPEINIEKSNSNYNSNYNYKPPSKEIQAKATVSM
jgi:hypothetical protein